jgi:hypothetical protein
MVDSWHPYKQGATTGQAGSEEGIIVLDEEHDDGARITLERDARTVPFAITCGIYGWMVHTRFFADESEGRHEYGLMKSALEDLLQAIPLESDPEVEAKMAEAGRECGLFVQRFP